MDDRPADPRVDLAVDRTALAWIRTTLTMATIGFGTVGYYRSPRAAKAESWPTG